MAFSQSVIRSQAPAKCGICETERPIKWKCIDCDNLLCNNCKDKVHPKFQNAKNHQVVNIKDVGQPTVVELNINKQYQTGLNIVDLICYCDDDSLWINSFRDFSLKRVKPEGTDLKIIAVQDPCPWVTGMAITQSNNLLISTGPGSGPILKEISHTGTATMPTNSVYNASPVIPEGIHITSDNKVLVGGVVNFSKGGGRGAVILMNQKGVHERVYEHNQHKQPIFTRPWRITSTSNGNIHVVDRESADRHRVVVLGQGGDIINIYTGDTEINKKNPFKSTDIVTTPRDNVIVTDPNTHTLHILNNAGLLVTHYKTRDINIIFPYSLAFSPTGQLYIACCRKNNDIRAKLYEVTISGC